MVRLLQGLVPEDKNLNIQIPIIRIPLREPQEVVWMTIDEWFMDMKAYKEIKDLNILKAINKQIAEWKRIAKEANRFQYYPVKNAGIEFWIPEGKYFISPAMIDKALDNFEFEHVSVDIENYLYDIGALYVNYTGMLD